MQRKILFAISIFIALLFPSGFFKTKPAFGGEGIIYPGKGVDDIRIGEKLLPRVEKELKERGVTLTRGEKGQVTSLRLSHPAFSVAVSLVRIKHSRRADVLRFYGKGDTDLKPGKVILQYPEQGIDFEIDKVDDRVAAIKVYSPVLPKFSIEQYKEQQKLFQPKK